MLFTGLRDYNHFKELFSKRVTNDGRAIKQNQILLSYYKNAIKNHQYFPEAKRVTNMASLQSEVFNRIHTSSVNEATHCCYIYGIGTFKSFDYKTDDCAGLCEDGDITSIRYVRVSDGRVYKMKAGKFFKRIILDTAYGRMLDEKTLLYILEVLSAKWQSIASEELGDFTLEVDDDFGAIYDSYNYATSDFCSCMTDEDREAFYKDSVRAKAASIWKDGKIYARCIIFTDVKDENTGEVLRLAERQYSADGAEIYKQILINKLIQADKIDGYKKVGAGCSDSRAFVSNKGEDWSDRKFSIQCYLDRGDTLSYQDSFKYYNKHLSKAYNNYDCDYDYALDTTDEYLCMGEYDSYHDTYCDEVQDVYVWNYYRDRYDAETCDVDEMNDFDYCERYGRYYDTTTYSGHYNDNIPRDRAVYSEFLDDYLYDDLVVYSKYEQSYIPDDTAIYYAPADDYFPNEESLQNWKDENEDKEEDVVSVDVQQQQIA